MPTTAPSGPSSASEAPAPSRVEVLDGAGVVRRPAGPWTPAVHGLLRHFEAVGFAGAPRVVGGSDDDGGHEVVTWLAGDVGARPLSPDVRSDETLASVARLLRAAHDASRGCPPSDRWQWLPGAPVGARDVVCHNDVGPWNVVFDGRRAVGLIDWDLAAPGPRAWDLAGAVWHFAPLYDDAECVRIGWPAGELPDRQRRVRLFLDSYGTASLGGLVRPRMVSYLARVRAAHAAPDGPGADVWLKVDPVLVERDMAFVEGLELP